MVDCNAILVVDRIKASYDCIIRWGYIYCNIHFSTDLVLFNRRSFLSFSTTVCLQAATIRCRSWCSPAVPAESGTSTTTLFLLLSICSVTTTQMECTTATSQPQQPLRAIRILTQALLTNTPAQPEPLLLSLVLMDKILPPSHIQTLILPTRRVL